MVYSRESHKGKYTPKHREKYVGDINNIIYRSGLERTFMLWCDDNTNVIKWNSEQIVIPYISPKDKRAHRYFVDFVIQVKNKKGELKVYLIEVKPSQYAKEPVPGKRKTKNFLTEVVQWNVNLAKWDAAKRFCKEKGWEFMVITEKDLGVKW